MFHNLYINKLFCIFAIIEITTIQKMTDITFHPSKHLRTSDKIWTLKSIAGEDLYLSELESNGRVIDGDFITRLLGKVDSPFYLSASGDFLFSAPLEIFKEEHGPLKKISTLEALELLSVPSLEGVIERGSTKLK